MLFQRHVAAEESEKEGADVGAVHVGISHDDDFVVAHAVQLEGPCQVSIYWKT